MSHHVSAVITWWNEMKYTKLCVESVLRHTRYSHEIVSVDNGSVDGTGAYLDDLAGRQTRIEDALGYSTYFTYDGNGRQTTVTDAFGGETYYVYDALGHAAYFGYDELGNQTWQKDALGNVTYFYFDELGRNHQTVDAEDRSVYYVFDEVGNRTAVTNARDNTTDFTYDLYGNMTATVDPIGKYAYYGYDEADQLTWRIDGNDVVTYYVYDAAGRSVEVRYPTDTTYFEYDLAGNRMYMANAASSGYFTYDELGRQSSFHDDTLDKWLYYTYDEVGSRATMHGPEGSTVYYAYDELGRLKELRRDADQVAYYVYDPLGRRARMDHSSGAVSYYTYDAASRLASIYHRKSTGEVIASFEYDHDDAGNPLRMTLANGDTCYYGYDDVYQLTSEVRLDSGDAEVYTQYFTYDASGNRILLEPSGTIGTEHITYEYNAADELTCHYTDTSASYFVYDGNGNTVSVADGTTTYLTYDSPGRVHRWQEGTFDESYRYDALGRRIRRGSDVQYFVYDGHTPAVVLDADDGGSTEVVSDEMGRPVCEESDPDCRDYLTNGSGTPVIMLDPSQGVAAQRDYDAFGQELAGSGSLRFGTKYGERLRSGDYYRFWTGVYDPRLGRARSTNGLQSQIFGSHPAIHGPRLRPGEKLHIFGAMVFAVQVEGGSDECCFKIPDELEGPIRGIAMTLGSRFRTSASGALSMSWGAERCGSFALRTSTPGKVGRMFGIAGPIRRGGRTVRVPLFGLDDHPVPLEPDLPNRAHIEVTEEFANFLAMAKKGKDHRYQRWRLATGRGGPADTLPANHLFPGLPHVPSKGTVRFFKVARRGGQAVKVAAIALDGVEVYQAFNESTDEGAKEVARKGGSWGGAWLGAKLFGAAGLKLGVVLAPKTAGTSFFWCPFIFAVFGGIVGGVAGEAAVDEMIEQFEDPRRRTRYIYMILRAFDPTAALRRPFSIP